MREIVPFSPTLIGTHDAYKSGIGGVFFSSIYDTPCVYSLVLPQDIQDRLVTFENPSGDFTMNDFELAAHIAQLILATHFMSPLQNILSGCDNTVATSWTTKGSVSRQGPAAALLLLKAQLLRQYVVSSSIKYYPGTDNIMANTASRYAHLSHHSLLTWCNLYFPQHRSWEFCPLMHDEQQLLFTALRYGICLKEWSTHDNVLTKQPCVVGTHSPLGWDCNHTSPPSPIPSPSSKCLHTSCDMEYWPPVATILRNDLLSNTSVPLVRRSPA